MTRLARDPMGRALELAALGRGRTAPNPPVGAVVVRAGQIVGEGYHTVAGEAHAETVALAEAGPLARDATLYVTLEPCCHNGRTPPCTDAIIAAGVAEVRYATGDPDPRVAGGGHRALVEAGIRVEAGESETAAGELLRGYLLRQQLGRPWVTAKYAMSLDGKIRPTSRPQASTAADGSAGAVPATAMIRWRIGWVPSSAIRRSVPAANVLLRSPKPTGRSDTGEVLWGRDAGAEQAPARAHPRRRLPRL